MHRLCGRIVIKGEAAAAKARGLRFDQAEDELHGNGRVRRAPAAFEDFSAHARGFRVRGDDHDAGALRAFAAQDGRCRLRRQGRVVLRANTLN